MRIKPLASALGAEITEVDLRALSDSDFDSLRETFFERGVIVVRDQDLSPDDHIAFAKRWGAININRFFRPTDRHPEIATVLKEADHKLNIGGAWHTDHSYDQIPAMGSILYAVETPPAGGDTLFCSMHAAYEGLSPGFQALLRSLKARHSSRHAFGYGHSDEETYKDGRLGNEAGATQDALHPVVIAHPVTGRPALYVNLDFTLGFEGWSDAESLPLMQQLEAHATRPEYTCRVTWQPGSLAMWDNRSVMHFAVNDYQGYRRLMHRITIEGCPLEGYRGV